MSSNEDDCIDGDSLATQGLKKRRIQRACDICRRKKSTSNQTLSLIETFRYIDIVYLVRCQSLFTIYMPVLHLNIVITGDGVHMPGNRCSNCVSYDLDCTYVEASKVRIGVTAAQGTPNDILSLETRATKRVGVLYV
jgi:hypothetical protein